MQRLLAVRICRLHSTLIEDMQTKNYIHVCCVHYFHYAYLVKQLAVRIIVCFIVIQKPGTMYVLMRLIPVTRNDSPERRV